jgi:hypothetical protein
MRLQGRLTHNIAVISFNEIPLLRLEEVLE